MDFTDYMIELEKFFEKDHRNPETRTIEDYLDAIAAVPLPDERSKKCLPAAEMFHNEGNRLLSMGEYKDAVLLYTDSLRAATPYSTCSALAYANRSAALYHLGAFKECITDIDRALNLPYPKHLRPKIITCKEAAVAKLRNGLNPEEGENRAAADALEYAHGENSKLPGVSLGIEIAHSPLEGQGLVAKKPFQPSDILVAEEPYWTVEPIFNADITFCHHCLKRSLCLIPCDRCPYSIYCSQECRAEAYQNYHRIECEILPRLIFKKPFDAEAIIVSLRCLNILTDQGANFEALYNDFEEIETNQDSAQLVFTKAQFDEDRRKMILNLKTNELKQLTPVDIFEMAYTIILLRNHTDFFKTDADVGRLARLLIKIRNICASNCLPIVFSGKTKIKAIGMFPSTSLANHACSNNTITYIDNNDRIVIRASQYIKPGDQIRYNFHDSKLLVGNIRDRSGSNLHCKRICTTCNNTFSFPIQRHPRIQMDKSLRRKLLKNPHDIEILWEVLKLLHVKKQRYSIQSQIIKQLLIEAYEGCIDHVSDPEMLQALGML